MLTLIALLLTISLLPACSVSPEADTENAPSAPEPAYYAQTEFSAREMIEYTVSMDICEDEARADDGTPLASYRFHLPVLTALRGDGTAVTEPRTEMEEQAAEAVKAFNDKFDKWAEAGEFQNLASSAEEDLLWCRAEGLDWSGGYTLELNCVAYQTEHLISVSGEYYSNTGGAHLNTYLLGWNFDLDSGTFFAPETLADDAGFQQAVSEELCRQAQEKAKVHDIEPEMFFWQDFEHTISDWSSYAVSFDETGMTVAFSPYELAAYAAGSQKFHLTYDWLLPHLSEHGRMVLGLETVE